MPQLSVLIVDDDRRQAAALELGLRQSGLKVSHVNSSLQALASVRSHSPDVALVACELKDPKVEPFQLCELLIKAGGVDAVIMMSDHPTRDHVFRALYCGALEFLVKPADPKSLTAKIGNAFGRTPRGLKAQEKDVAIDFGSKPMSTAEKVDLVMEQAVTVRALPHAVAKILQLVASNNSAAADLSRAVECDPAIAAAILRRARSATYSRGAPVPNVQQAVVRLGFRECKELVLGLSIIRLFDKEDKTFGFSRIGYWLHSTACGIIAKIIGQAVSFKNHDSALSAGLLHDIGKIILDDFLTEEFQIAVRSACRQETSLLTAEEATLERTHVLVGSTVVGNWQFPAPVVEVVAGHHDRAAFAQSHSHTATLVGAVYLSNQIAKALLIGQAGDFLVEYVPHRAWATYGFSAITLELLDAIYDELEEFCSFLQLRDAELQSSLERKHERGVAVQVCRGEAVDPLLTFFLLNQGFEVRACTGDDDIPGAVESARLVVVEADSDDRMKQSYGDVALSTTAPVICITREGSRESNAVPDDPQVFTAHYPLNCFSLARWIDGVLPESEAEAQVAASCEPR